MTVVAVFFAVVALVCGIGWYAEVDIRETVDLRLLEARELLRMEREKYGAAVHGARGWKDRAQCAEAQLNGVRKAPSPEPSIERP